MQAPCGRRGILRKRTRLPLAVISVLAPEQLARRPRSLSEKETAPKKGPELVCASGTGCACGGKCWP